jgi:cystathionine gamma-synthase
MKLSAAIDQDPVNRLLYAPIWAAADLGQPLPPSAHAVSMALPLWDHVVGYEEKTPAVMEKLLTGYPRFVIHPLVRAVARELAGEKPCLPFPSRDVAERCLEFLARNNTAGQLVSVRGICGVATDQAGFDLLKAFWQHTGLIVSTRQAEAFLAARPEAADSEAVRASLRRQLAGFYGCGADDVFLTPTGMAAQYAALRVVLARSPGHRTVQLGFPYVDTYKLQQKMGTGGILLHRIDQLEMDLAKILSGEPIAACFGEIPGNPLLGSCDLRRISPLLRDRAIPIPMVADDVVATPANVDLSPYVDLIATSLTKFIVGTGEAMGGAVICNPRSPMAAELKALLQAQHEELLWGDDAAVLEKQAHGFPERMRRHNESGLLIAERLRNHPAIERVWYPRWEFNEAYETVRRPAGGYGALITFLPKRAEATSPVIYDRLRFCKGPSLGTIFSLACPFTLLAHYTELPWAESCGVSRHLIRISVGLEDPEDLWNRLNEAINSAPTIA